MQRRASKTLTALRDFSTTGGLIRRSDFDSVLAKYPNLAINDFADQLTLAGFLTARQQDGLVTDFTAHQIDAAEVLIQTAIERGLIRQADQAEIMETFSDVLQNHTIIEHLQADGRITSAQAEDLSAGPGLSERVAKIRVAAQPFIDTARIPSLPFVGAPRKYVKSVQRRMRKEPRAFVVTGAILLTCLAATVWWFRSGPVKLNPDCTMNSSGIGHCTFSNTTDDVASGCGHVYAFCGRLADADMKLSATFCSGEVQPRESKVMEFRVAGFDRLVPSYGDWRDSCAFDWLPE